MVGVAEGHTEARFLNENVVNANFLERSDYQYGPRKLPYKTHRTSRIAASMGAAVEVHDTNLLEFPF